MVASRLRLCLSLLPSLVPLACDDPPPPAIDRPIPATAQAPPAPPAWVTPTDPKIEWNGGKFTLAGTRLTGRATATNGRLEVNVLGAPKGTKLSLGNASATVEDAISTKLEASVGPSLAPLTPTKALAFDLELDIVDPLHIELPDGKSIDVKFAGVKTMGVQAALLEVAAGKPFAIAADPAGHATYFEAYFGSLPADNVVGDAPSFGHFIRVAIKRDLPLRPGDKRCKAHSGGTGELMMEDWEVTVYELATAKEVGKNTFAAKKACPPTWLGDEAISRPETKTIHNWIRGL